MEKQNRDNAEISEIERLVYDILLDTVQEEYRIPWVTPIFVPGHLCFDAYCDMQAAYERLRQRLGAADEDPDYRLPAEARKNPGSGNVPLWQNLSADTG